MNNKEIIDLIDDILNKKKSTSSSNTDSIDDAEEVIEDFENPKISMKNMFSLFLRLVFNTARAPFKIIGKFLRDEFILAVKKDMKIYFFVMLILAVTFIVFAIMWLFISIVIGVYFYEQGDSVVLSLAYSLIFQFVSLILFLTIAYIASKKLKSLEFIDRLGYYTK